jgi:NAD+ diphosphatase
LFGQLDDFSYGLAGYAAQLLYWQRTSCFCGICGQRTESVSGDWGKRCTNCGHTTYPRVSPAVLALIHDGERILLVHKPGFGDMYSIIAGFVEPGESLEECVQREVYEEVGVDVSAISYVGSQPWPFPHQLMIGYTAQYAGGEICIDTTELDVAQWFHVDALPSLPGPLSLSRQMIDAWARVQRERRMT